MTTSYYSKNHLRTQCSAVCSRMPRRAPLLGRDTGPLQGTRQTPSSWFMPRCARAGGEEQSGFSGDVCFKQRTRPTFSTGMKWGPSEAVGSAIVGALCSCTGSGEAGPCVSLLAPQKGFQLTMQDCLLSSCTASQAVPGAGRADSASPRRATRHSPPCTLTGWRQASCSRAWTAHNFSDPALGQF